MLSLLWGCLPLKGGSRRLEEVATAVPKGLVEHINIIAGMMVDGGHYKQLAGKAFANRWGLHKGLKQFLPTDACMPICHLGQVLILVCHDATALVGQVAFLSGGALGGQGLLNGH